MKKLLLAVAAIGLFAGGASAQPYGDGRGGYRPPLPQSDYAYEVVLRDLQARLDSGQAGKAQDVVTAALAALKALGQLSTPALEQAARLAATEQAEEAAREKLDP